MRGVTYKIRKIVMGTTVTMTAKVKKKVYIGVFLLFVITILNQVMKYDRTKSSVPYPDQTLSGSDESVISTPKCTIPDLRAFNKDAANFFYKKSYISCSDKQLLTYLERQDGKVSLNIRQNARRQYSWFPITCCYSTVRRDYESDNPDNNVAISECRSFTTSVEIEESIIKVTCSSFYRTVYSNVHYSFFDKGGDNNSRIQDEKPSVLLIGIDSVSRLNLQRTMPNTFKFLKRTDWVNLKGYNKIADNTFPNVLGFLTGMNDTHAETTCGPFSSRFLDDCDFVWKRFQRQGYTTLYAEDWSQFGTFNYYRKGFYKPPTDFYFRPYFLTADQLPSVNTLNGISYCSGPETSGERILNAVRDFSEYFKHKPTFSFFWMNTFSHNNMNDPTMMDDVVHSFLEQLLNSEGLQNTIVIFLSDHGFRFGKIRYTLTGWLEERLPFVYIKLPEKFKRNHPKAARHLQRNANTLTNPYNLFATFEHILGINDPGYRPKGVLACPNCKSLLSELEDHSCEELGIAKHWCACTRYKRVDASNRLIGEVADFVMVELNNVITSYGELSRPCAEYVLRKIASSSVSPHSLNAQRELTRSVLLTWETFPEAAFEATVTVHYDGNRTGKFSLGSGISRLDRYGGKVLCLPESPLQKYCYCRKMATTFQNYFCNHFYCIGI